MICKNCKTAVGENDTVCSNCGNKLKNNNNLWIIVVILVAIAIVVAIVLNNNKNKANTTPAITESEEPTAPAETLAPTETSEETTGPTDEPKEETTSQEEAPIPTPEADLDKPIEEVWIMIDDLITNVNNYYKDYEDTVVFISKNGYLYDTPARNYVFSDDLVGLTDMDEKYSKEGILFFYLRPVDLKGYGDLKVSENTELKIFVGYETKEGYALSAENESGGIISSEELAEVLDKYSWEHGMLSNYSQDSDEFSEIINAVNNYNLENDGEAITAYDVRHMISDNKYINIVLSPKEKSNELKQYIVENTGDVFQVKLGGIEQQIEDIKLVNNAIPDFNTMLMPNYNISVISKYLNNDFDNIVEIMKTNELIKNDDLPVNFQSGTNEFLFLEFASGKKFVGHFEDKTWQMYPIETYDEAILLMEGLTKKPPTYVLKHF